MMAEKSFVTSDKIAERRVDSGSMGATSIAYTRASPGARHQVSKSIELEGGVRVSVAVNASVRGRAYAGPAGANRKRLLGCVGLELTKEWGVRTVGHGGGFGVAADLKGYRASRGNGRTYGCRQTLRKLRHAPAFSGAILSRLR